MSPTPRSRPRDCPTRDRSEGVDQDDCDLKALRVAPVSILHRPAILSGRHRGLLPRGLRHRVEGQRQKGEDEARPSRRWSASQFFPASSRWTSTPLKHRRGVIWSVPTASIHEGVRARAVRQSRMAFSTSFLMSRARLRLSQLERPWSRAGRNEPVARQSEPRHCQLKPVTREQLKRLLIAQIKQQNKPSDSSSTTFRADSP